MTAIHPATLKFLKDLAKNNDRDWFNQHKSSYLTAHQNLCDFLDRFIFTMSKHDELETLSGKESLLRIYSDVRFSKNKAPYKPRFAFSLPRATKLRRGGYCGVVKPGESFLAVANNVFISVRPFFDYMSDVLTTNANGQSLFEES